MSTQSFFQRSKLTRILWTFRREFALAGLFSLLANLLMLSPSLYMMQIYDRVYLSHSELTLLASTLLLLLFVGVMCLTEWLRSRLLVRTGVQFDNALNELVFRAGFQAELQQSGHKTLQAMNDLTQIRQFLTGTGIIAIFDAPWTPVYVAVSWLLHPLLGGLAAVFVLILVALAWYHQVRSHELSDVASDSEMEVNRFLTSKLRNAGVVESMGMLGDLRRRWKSRQADSLETHDQAFTTSHDIKAVVKFFRYSQQSLSLCLGAWLTIKGEISLGAMFAANILMGRASSPIEVLVATWSDFLMSRGAFGRLEKLIDEHPEDTNGHLDHSISGSVELRNFSATAPGRAEPIIKSVSTLFPAGELTAVIGPSGSGKSTLARSILGIWPYTEGSVMLDGTGVGSYDRDRLGPQLGYLPQDVELFEGSIAENIARFGELDAPKVIEAAQRAGMHEMILRLPMGYDTPIGPGGSVLSGGQRQRVALARALYGDPQLLVLDEPNANLDDAGEAALTVTLRELKARGRTVFLVTHRTSALQIVDRLVVMQNGHITANGPRDEILAAMRSQPPHSPYPNQGVRPQPA